MGMCKDASSDRISTRQPQPYRRLPPPGSCFSRTSSIETRFKVKCIHWWTVWHYSSFCPHPSSSEVTKTTSTSSSARKPSLKATFFFQLHCNCISLEIQHPPWQAFFDIFWYVLIIGKDSWQMLTALKTVCMASKDGFYKLRWLILHELEHMWKSRLHVSHACRNAESLRNICDIAWYMQLYLIHVGLYDIFVYCVYHEFIVIHLIFTHMCASVFSIECCVLLVVTSDFRQRSPPAALRQQQILCGCPCSLRKPNMIVEFPCVFRYSMWSACEGFPSSWVWIWCEISSLEVWFWIRHSEVTTTSMTSSRCSVGPTVFFFRCHSQCLWHLSPLIHIYIHTYLYLCFEWYLCSLLVHGKRSNAWR